MLQFFARSLLQCRKKKVFDMLIIHICCWIWSCRLIASSTVRCNRLNIDYLIFNRDSILFASLLPRLCADATNYYLLTRLLKKKFGIMAKKDIEMSAITLSPSPKTSLPKDSPNHPKE